MFSLEIYPWNFFRDSFRVFLHVFFFQEFLSGLLLWFHRDSYINYFWLLLTILLEISLGIHPRLFQRSLPRFFGGLVPWLSLYSVHIHIFNLYPYIHSYPYIQSEFWWYVLGITPRFFWGFVHNSCLTGIPSGIFSWISFEITPSYPPFTPGGFV